jgi:hypothetical protein
MKIFNIYSSKKIKLIAIALGLLFFSCSDYLDVDTDTDSPTQAPLKLLLSGIQVNVNAATDFQFYTGDILQVYTHQMVVREEQDQYGTKVDNILMQNEWDNIYLTITNIESLINQATESGDMVYVGVGQMMKAYLMSIAVDLWGDVPYTEVSQLQNGIVSPVFDDQKEIYAAIFELIETAKTNISSNEGVLKPGADDLFYAGNINKWVRFANTFKLKLYNQTRLSPTFDQAGFNALIAENNFFTSINDDFQFTQTSNQSPSDERNRFFLASYNSTQFSTYMSPWFYEILKGMNPTIHTGNEDPRVAYYFFKQLVPDQFPPDQGDESTGDPNADYWDASTGFFSIRFGSVGPDRDWSAENSYTYPGIFIGGRYDDGEGGNVNDMMAGVDSAPQAPTGKAPHRMLTYDEFLYIQAELMHAGLIAGDASSKLREAMIASFAKVDQVVTLNTPPQSVPIITGTTESNTFIDNVITEYTNASSDKKLEIIMTQKWVATFGDPFDQYNDYRRTGYPILANPNSGTQEYQLNNGDGFPLNDAHTVLNNPFQVSLFWPQSELNANQNAPSQKNPATYKIFWDN